MNVSNEKTVGRGMYLPHQEGRPLQMMIRSSTVKKTLCAWVSGGLNAGERSGFRGGRADDA